MPAMKLSARVALSFAALLLMMIGVGAAGALAMSRMQASTLDLTENWLPAVRQLSKLQAQLNAIRRKEFDHVLSQSQSEHDKLEAQLRELAAGLAPLEQALADRPVSAEEAALQAAYHEARRRYLGLQPQLLALSRGDDDALGLLRGESRQAFFQTLEAVDKLVVLSGDGASAARERSMSAYGAAQWGSGGLLAVALAAGSLLTVAIVRGVQRSLGGDPAEVAEIARAIAAGNLAIDVPCAPGDERSVMAAMRHMRDGLAQVVRRVRAGSESIATASTQIASGNADLSRRTEQQAGALQQTSATMHQLDGTVRDNSESARQADALARAASSAAEHGGEVVARVVATMKDIDGGSRRIEEIIGVIDTIAFQTNILALNAAVEAARAGEQGRGFAVVASEVRSLAGRSAEAARQIKGLIGASVDQARQGSGLADEAGRAVQEIVTSIHRVGHIVGSIAQASVEQSKAVSEVEHSVSQMDTATQQNAALVEQGAAAADSLRQQAALLVQAVATFRIDTSRARSEPGPVPTPVARSSAPGAVPTGAAAAAEDWITC